MATSLPAVPPWAPEERPSSFDERGFALPFTAPMLLGARVRELPGEAQQLILPGLAGRGTYILGWQAVLPLALPTLHDEALWREVAVLPHLTPGAIRGAARRVAAAGFAGRAAMRAAVAAELALEEARREARAALARRFDARAEPARLDRLAGLLAEVGAEPGGGAPLRARLDALGRLAARAAAAEAWPEGRARQAALLLAAGAQMASEAVLAPLLSLRQRLDALPADLDAPEALAAVADGVRQVEGLLDGWDHLAALVEATGGTDGARLREALVALPPVPAEAERWVASPHAAALLTGSRSRLAPLPVSTPEARLAFIEDAERARAFAP